jgi:hypothetical protein
VIPSRAACSTSASEITDRPHTVFVLVFRGVTRVSKKKTRVILLSRYLDHVSECVFRRPGIKYLQSCVQHVEYVWYLHSHIQPVPMPLRIYSITSKYAVGVIEDTAVKIEPMPVSKLSEHRAIQVDICLSERLKPHTSAFSSSGTITMHIKHPYHDSI